MDSDIKNLVFSGGGVLGIAYLGLLHSFYERDLIPNVERLAGTSAGAITACLTSFNLPFTELKAMADSLDYARVIGRDEIHVTRNLPRYLKHELNKIFGNIDCVYRLIKQYGWYSSSYFYAWIKDQIASQFDSSKKSPPYTFEDFYNTNIHKNQRPFKDLYIVGTDITHSSSSIFSYKSTPMMEVAEAVRISMSVPLFFEAIKSSAALIPPDENPYIYSDGGLMYNYPINLFDEWCPPNETLGSLFITNIYPATINNIIDFITHVLSCNSIIQAQLYANNPTNIARTIEIFTGDISSFDFNIKTGDDTYNTLYRHGYVAAEKFLSI